MKKKVISILLCAAMCVGMVTACGSKKADKEADSSTDEKDKVITVAANGSFYPIIYTDDNGELTGFEHDVMEEIGKRSGYEIKFEVVGDYSAMFEGLDSGKYDTIAGQVSVTDEREKKYTFSDVYGYNAIKLAVRGDDPATSIEDMQGRKICIEFGTVLEAALNKINDTYSIVYFLFWTATNISCYEKSSRRNCFGHYHSDEFCSIYFRGYPRGITGCG